MLRLPPYGQPAADTRGVQHCITPAIYSPHTPLPHYADYFHLAVTTLIFRLLPGSAEGARSKQHIQAVVPFRVEGEGC